MSSIHKNLQGDDDTSQYCSDSEWTDSPDLPLAQWSTITVLYNCETPLHRDAHNGPEPSLRIENSSGAHLVECEEGWKRGASFSLQLQAVRFLTHKRHHFTCPWTDMDRVVLSAYAVNRWECIWKLHTETPGVAGVCSTTTTQEHPGNTFPGFAASCGVEEWCLGLGVFPGRSCRLFLVSKRHTHCCSTCRSTGGKEHKKSCLRRQGPLRRCHEADSGGGKGGSGSGNGNSRGSGHAGTGTLAIFLDEMD